MAEFGTIGVRKSGQGTTVARITTLVDQALAHCEKPWLEYRQFRAALNSERAMFAGTALERLVGRCWNDLTLATRAQLLEVARTLRQNSGSTEQRFSAESA